jgi:hypothetical protein
MEARLALLFFAPLSSVLCQEQLATHGKEAVQKYSKKKFISDYFRTRCSCWVVARDPPSLTWS